MACLVRVNGKLVPSCATRAEEAMVIESETEPVQSARKMALELLLRQARALAPVLAMILVLALVPILQKRVKLN